MRKSLFKLHSYVALVCFIPLLIVSLTGSILVFKTEIDQLLMPQVASLDYADSPQQRMPIGELKAIIESSHPDYVLGTWEMFDDGIEADRVYLIKKGTSDWYKIYFDPFSGRALSQPVSLTSDLTDWLLSLHYTFLLNDLNDESQFGTLIGLFVAIFLTFLGVSGLIIHRKFWRAIFKLRWSTKARVFTGDLHRVVGLWGSPVLLILGITGIYFNAVEYYHEVVEHADEPAYKLEQPLYSSDIDLDALLADSQKQLESYTPTYLLMPYEPDLQITFYGYQPGFNPLASNYASTVTYDKSSGELVAALDGRKAGALIKVTDSFRELHFGSFAGLASKILWCLFGLSPVILGISGIYLWISRKLKRKKSL